MGCASSLRGCAEKSRVGRVRGGAQSVFIDALVFLFFSDKQVGGSLPHTLRRFFRSGAFAPFRSRSGVTTVFKEVGVGVDGNGIWGKVEMLKD